MVAHYVMIFMVLGQLIFKYIVSYGILPKSDSTLASYCPRASVAKVGLWGNVQYVPSRQNCTHGY